MTKGITAKEPDPRVVYGDIIGLPHHVSDHHPKMSLHDRAAQFAPYAALSGYHEMVGEEARTVDRRIEPGDEADALLNRNLNRIARLVAGGAQPTVSITYFIPDPVKDGGRYETVTEKIRKIDAQGQRIVLEKKAGTAGACPEIRIPDVLELHIESPEAF